MVGPVVDVGPVKDGEPPGRVAVGEEWGVRQNSWLWGLYRLVEWHHP